MLLKVVVESDGKVESSPAGGPAGLWRAQKEAMWLPKLELPRDLGGEEVKCLTGADRSFVGSLDEPRPK